MDISYLAYLDVRGACSAHIGTSCQVLGLQYLATQGLFMIPACSGDIRSGFVEAQGHSVSKFLS